MLLFQTMFSDGVVSDHVLRGSDGVAGGPHHVQEGHMARDLPADWSDVV